MDHPTDDEQAELIRKKYLYRQLILTKKVGLPRTAATKLIGPDCAYHLYSQHQPTKPADESDAASLSQDPRPHGES